MTKYKLTAEKIDLPGKTLHRIVCVKAFSDVSVGEKGGFIESESNLSHTGDAWVSGNSLVFGNSRVSGNARVSGNSRVSGNARVSGNSRVSGNARVSGNSIVSGNSRVSENARVFGDSIVTSKASTLNTAHYRVTITDNNIAIGCQVKRIEDWIALNEDQSIKIDGYESAKKRFKYKEFIISLAEDQNGVKYKR